MKHEFKYPKWDEISAKLAFAKDHPVIGTGYFANIGRYVEMMYTPIAITKKLPEGVDIPILNFLLPMDELSPDNKKVSKNSYIEWYFKNILRRIDCYELVQKLINKYKNPILICSEKPFVFCHRYIISHWITERTGLFCNEIPEVFEKKKAVNQYSKTKK